MLVEAFIENPNLSFLHLSLSVPLSLSFCLSVLSLLHMMLLKLLSLHYTDSETECYWYLGISFIKPLCSIHGDP